MTRSLLAPLLTFTRVRTLALTLTLAVAGCASKPPAAAPAPPPVAAPAPLPACPEAILPGGDPLESEGFEGKPIVRVCVVGGSAESTKGVARVGLLQAGDTFTADRVRADLEGLLRLGTFDDASAYGLRVRQGEGVVLFYALHDRPRVAQIGFEGAKVLGDATLSAKLPIERGGPFDPVRVTTIAQAVREEYRLRGYDSCRVVVVTEPVPSVAGASSVRVRIKVDEGPLSRLSKIEFRGNQAVPEADLRKVAALKVGQPFVQDEVDRALLELSALMYDRGLVQMRVNVEPSAKDPSGAVPLTFVVEEGAVHTIGALHVTKLGAMFERELLDKVLRARPKQVFSRSALVADMERVKAFFAKRGQSVEIVPLTEVDSQKKTVALTLQIDAR
jgi:outer membrane protein insertion porin family